MINKTINQHYMAGFLDARATISFVNNTNVKISMTHYDKEILILFKQKYGGNINKIKSGSFLYQIGGLLVNDMMIELKSYSFVLKEEMECMIKYASLKGFNAPVVVKQREKVIETFKLLKEIRKSK